MGGQNLKSGFLLTNLSLLLIVATILLTTTSFAVTGSQMTSLNSWQSGIPYSPGSVEVGASGAYNGILYYVGGQIHPGGAYTNAVYFASILLSGSIGSWTKSQYPYPGSTGIWALPCPAYNGFVYCIGGNMVPGGTSKAVYFADCHFVGGRKMECNEFLSDQDSVRVLRSIHQLHVLRSRIAECKLRHERGLFCKDTFWRRFREMVPDHFISNVGLGALRRLFRVHFLRNRLQWIVHDQFHLLCAYFLEGNWSLEVRP